jgi:hypothetical protein
VLNATSAVQGPFLLSGGHNALFAVIHFTDNYNATHGLIEVAESLAGNVSGVNGGGTVAIINFTALSNGASLLHLQDTKLINTQNPPFGELIPHTLVDGLAYVGLTDVAIGEIDAPSTIPQGSMGYINVTAQNRGQAPETFDVTLTYNGTIVGPGGVNTVTNLAPGNSQIVNFTWDTSTIPMGVYNITATATTVPGEIDIGDNTLSVMVQVGIRDLAIASITDRTIVGQGYSVTFNVTVQNNGQATETVNVTLYVDSNVIGNETVHPTGGAQETVRFIWNATDVFMGNHNLTAYVWPVPFEANTTNNNYTQTVHVGVPGDISGPTLGVYDGKVDMRDISYLVLRFNSKPGFPNWKPNADINDDGVSNMRDISIAILNFNKHE